MKIGIQLYSCPDKVEDEAAMERTLAALAEMGYDGVEFFTYGAYGMMDPRRLRARLAECGLEGINVHLHIPLEQWFGDMRGVLDYAKEVGLPAVTLPYLHEERRSPELFARILGEIPRWIAQCGEYGLEFCYHNHDFEFRPYGKGTLLEAVAGASPEMKIELDTFWARFAGHDPCRVMEELGGKLRLVHIKDYRELAPFYEMKFTAIGTGVMDNAAVADKAAAMGQEWLIVEQDNSPIDTLESARLSIEGVHRLLEKGVRHD